MTHNGSVLAFVAEFEKRQPELLLSKDNDVDGIFYCSIDNVKPELKLTDR
jgi:hypothetical protein